MKRVSFCMNLLAAVYRLNRAQRRNVSMPKNMPLQPINFRRRQTELTILIKRTAQSGFALCIWV